MSWLKIIWRELVALFVDDGSLAVAVLAWLLFSGLLLPQLGLPPVWPPLVLVVGLLAILAESVLRAARRKP